VSGAITAAPEDGRAARAGRATPSVAVVIPAHRASPAFTRCLEAVQALDPAPDELVVVVDGGDEQVAAEAVAAGARVVRQLPQSGPAVARNTGAARVSSDVVLFLDSDVAAAPDVVGVVAHELRRDPGVAAVIGSYDDRPPAHNLASLYMNLRHHYVHQRAREAGSTFWGACGAIRRDVLERVGGFDEDYVAPSIEDIELGYRITGAGERVRVVKDLHVTHLKRWDVRSLLKTDVVFRAMPWSALILRTRRLEDDLNISWAERLKSAGVVGALAGLVTAPWWSPAALLALTAVLAVLAADLPFVRFLHRRGGARLALFGAAWHLAYHLYTVLAFTAMLVRHLVFGPQPAEAPWPGSPRRWAPGGSCADAPGPPAPQTAGVPQIETVTIAHRVARASPTVAADQLRAQSQRVRRGVPLVLLLLAGGLLLPAYHDAVHVNGLAHVSIAQHYADGRFDEAVNAYWGPLLSWLLAPLVWLGIEPLLAGRLLQLGVGCAALLAVRRLCIRCGVRVATADGITLVTVPLILYLALSGDQADLLLSVLLLLFVADVLPREGEATTAGAWKAGLWGALAVLAKPYALPVVVGATVAANLVAARRSWLRRRSDTSDQHDMWRVARQHALRGVATVGVVLLIIAPWVALISVHTGSPTLSKAWGYNAAVVAPGSTGQPLERGLVEPPHPNALSAWEDPSTMPLVTGGWSASPESGQRLLDNLTDNLADLAGLVVGQFLVVPLFALAGAVALMRRRRTQPPSVRSAWPAVVLTVGIYALGYLVTFVEPQYLWFVVLALVPLAAMAVDLPILRPRLRPDDPSFPTWRLAGFFLLALGVTVETALNLPRQPPGSEPADVAASLRSSEPAAAAGLDGARVASDGDWEASSILCFHLGCTYLGVSSDPDEVARRATHHLEWHHTDAPAATPAGRLVARVDGLSVRTTG
jgi:GT2 family glycosyltransferase